MEEIKAPNIDYSAIGKTEEVAKATETKTFVANAVNEHTPEEQAAALEELITNDTPKENVKEPELVKVNVGKLYLRSEPKQQSKAICILKKNDELIALGFEAKHLKVETEDGKVGYVDKRFIQAV